MKVVDCTIVTAGDLGADLTTDAISVEHLLHGAIHAVISGGASPAGSLIVQGSVDGTNFVTMGSAYTVAISADGDTLIQFANIGVKKIRLFYDRTSGDGAMTAKFFGKGL